MRREHLEREWTWAEHWDHLRLVHGLPGREVPVEVRECDRIHAECFHPELGEDFAPRQDVEPQTLTVVVGGRAHDPGDGGVAGGSPLPGSASR